MAYATILDGMRIDRPPPGPAAWQVAGAAATAAAALHIGPAGTWLPPVRRALFPGLDGQGHPGHIALTFDDGPDRASTPRFLDALDGLGVRATFFLLGAALAEAPEVARDIVARGHEVGLHGWDHRRPWRPAPVRELRDLRRAVRAAADICGVRPRWYRPPYGILTGDRWAAAHRLGLRTVLWSAWGRDWVAGAEAATVVRTVERRLEGGATVLLHDSDRTSAPGSWRATLRALPVLVQRCRHQGLTVGPLRDHGTDDTGW
ncbi:polysaccharide deacetylase family protein [Streptomyces sp. NPDC050315]|uniref:polysaccharide deacetylase family protein n=1 Tax=Streptomyces sp. NPDC050315 TaxID=3155039 RepID=UPI00342F7672